MVRTLLAILTVLLFLVEPSVGHSSVFFNKSKKNKLNLFGYELEQCSKAGMAQAGFVKGSQCVHVPMDEESHNICVNIPKMTGGDFCEVTGQSWCHLNMTCTEDEDQHCPVRHYCVSEKAFIKYIADGGGCDRVGHIYCEATNMLTILDLEELVAQGDFEAADALDCIREKCKML